MKKTISTAILTLTLAACGASPRETIVQACIRDTGMQKATCECMGDEAVDQLDKPLLKKFAAAAEEGKEATDAFSEDDGAQILKYTMVAAIKCAKSK